MRRNSASSSNHAALMRPRSLTKRDAAARAVGLECRTPASRTHARQDPLDEREVERAHGVAMCLGEAVERTVAEAECALFVGERLVAAVTQDLLDRRQVPAPADLAADRPRRLLDCRFDG